MIERKKRVRVSARREKSTLGQGDLVDEILERTRNYRGQRMIENEKKRKE